MQKPKDRMASKVYCYSSLRVPEHIKNITERQNIFNTDTLAFIKLLKMLRKKKNWYNMHGMFVRQFLRTF